jgi:hypothetical protein
MAVFENNVEPLIVESCVVKAGNTVVTGMILSHDSEQTEDGKVVVKLPGAKTDKFFGVALQDGLAGEVIDVIRLGRAPIKVLGTESTLGSRIIGGTDGLGLTADAAAGVNQFPIGILCQTGVANELLDCLILPQNYQGA